MPAPRIAAIHDLSCFGRCSLTIALGGALRPWAQCCPLPTALLSAHTGISGFTFLDTTDEMLPHLGATGRSFRSIFRPSIPAFSAVPHKSILWRTFCAAFTHRTHCWSWTRSWATTAHRTKPVRPRCARVFGSWWRRPMSSRQISQRPLFYWTFPTMNPKPPMPRSWCGH